MVKYLPTLLSALLLCPFGFADDSKSEFFRYLNFENNSLLARNPGLNAVKTELAKTPPDYGVAMTGLWSVIPVNYYSCGTSRVIAASAPFAQDFFSWIDLDTPGLEATKALVAAENYPAALDAWRDYTVAKFRQLVLPQVYQQDYKSHPRQASIARLLLGETSYSDYLAEASGGGIDFYEIYGMSGAPGTIGPIDWLAQPSTPDTSLDSKYSYANFSFAGSLVYRYHTGQVLAGLSNNQIIGTIGSGLTLTGSGTQVTATVTSPHGLSNGRLIRITNATPSAYNGLFAVSVIDSTRFSYTALSEITSSPATGTSRRATLMREPDALAKWFEIAGDFSSRQKNLVEPLRFVENTDNRSTYRTLWQRADWGGTAQSALSQAGRVKELLAAIAIYCKLLPEAVPVDRSWGTMGQAPVTTALAPGAAGLIPSEELARICLSLMADHSEALLLRYYRAGAVPNQRFAGLHALYCAAFALNEFKGAPELLTQTDLAFANYGNGMFYPDGAMLERSPNYNQGDARSIRELYALLADVPFTPGVSLLEDKLALYDRTTAFMQRPLGDLPRMASYASKSPPALWESPAIVASWRNTFLQGDFAKSTEATAAAIYQGILDSGNPMPATTSAAFPYAGYYMMRNGWASKSHWLYFANTPPGRGHRQVDQNGIQISAFGRELLTTAGPPPYNPTFVVASQADDYNGFTSYQGEGSSYKCNTVVVDGRSQNEGGIVNATVTSSPMPNPWFTSADFDYVEGTYNAGYGGEGVYNRFLPVGDSGEAINGITHKRGVIFLRQAGIWLVTDRMTPADALSHSYRQVWNFPAKNDTFVGFLPSEVTTDMTTLTVNTASTNGPNVSLHHLGPRWVNLLTYSGSRTPYAGWWGSGIGGLRLETANVHAVLNGSGPQMFVTAIVPRDTGTTGPVNTDFTHGPLATTSVVDRSFGLVNGSTVRFVEGQQAQTLVIGNRTITATTLLIVTAADQSQRGLAIGSSTAGLPSAFAFTAGPESFSAGTSITTPDTFTWMTEGDFTVPTTSSLDHENWDGGGADNNWSTANNWNHNTVPGFPTDLTFAGTTRLEPNNDLTGITVNGITFNSGAGAFVLGGNSFTLDGKIENKDDSLQTINNSMTLSGVQAVTSSGTGAIALGGALGGDGGITKEGPRALIFSGTTANTYTGLTTVNAGSLELGKPALTNAIIGDLAIGNGLGAATVKLLAANQIADTAVVTINEGGVLDLSGGNETLGQLWGEGTVNNSSSSGRTLLLNHSATDTTFAGNITQTGGGAVTVNRLGSNKVTLNGSASTFTGSLLINLGTIEYTHPNALGNGTAIRLGNAASTGGTPTLIYNTADTAPSNLSARTITINANAATAGLIRNNSPDAAAALTIGAVTTLGTTAKSLTLGGTNTGANTVSGVIADGASGLSLIKADAGTWTLSNANTYTGPTTVNTGTLILAAGSSTSPITVKDGAFLGFTLGSSITSSAALSLEPGAKITITATPTLASYTLFAATSITGTPELASTIPGYALVKDGNSLKLNSVAGSYSSWSTVNAGGQPAGLDWDNDGMPNGVEYFMNAAAGFTANPAITGANTIIWPNGGNIPASAYGTLFVVQTSTNLQSWTNVHANQLTTNTDGPGGALTYTITSPAPFYIRLKVTPAQ